MGKDHAQSLPDVDAYLRRIGMEDAGAPSAQLLDELTRAHQLAIPFENLDVYDKHLTPSLEVDDLFDKIITRKRGGYCFEMNALFGALLRALGFDVQPCMARVTFRPNPRPLITHRANIVTIGAKRYLADVGFGGPMAAFAPEIEDGASRTEQGQTFTLYQHDGYWWDVGYTGSTGEETRVLRFCTMPVEEHDFIPFSFFQSQNPESTFRLHRLANVKTEDGAFDLRDTTFTEHVHGVKTSREVQDPAELDQLLKEKFGIVDWR